MVVEADWLVEMWVRGQDLTVDIELLIIAVSRNAYVVLTLSLQPGLFHGFSRLFLSFLLSQHLLQVLLLYLLPLAHTRAPNFRHFVLQRLDGL